MSRQAPHFSGSVIGATSGLWSGRRALDVIHGSEAEEDLESPDRAADPTGVVALLSPKKLCCSARNVNEATSTIPAPVIHTAIGKAFHAPTRIVISAANPLNPGMPIDAAEAMTKENAAKGSVRLRFKRARSSRSRVCVRR